MKTEFRKTGIDLIGDVPWGTHFCQLYQTKEDLLDILVPYFRAGLENNEFCMWITSEPFEEQEVLNAMKKALPNFDQYLRIGQIEILPYTEWYLKGGEFDSQRTLNGWVDRLNQALARGYEGLRLTGDTFWLEKKDWKRFTDYENEVDNVIRKYQMIAVCTYSLDKCGANEVIDVISHHQFALIRREGKWEVIESSERRHAEGALSRLASFPELNPNPVVEVDLTGHVYYLNPAAEQLFPDLQTAGLQHPWLTGLEALAEMFENGRKSSHVREVKIGDFWFEQAIYYVLEGERMRIYGLDITERKQAEEAIKASEERARDQAARLQAALNTAPAIIWIARDRECREITGNRESFVSLRVPEGTNMSKSGPATERLAHYRVFKDGVELTAREMPIQRVATSGQGLTDYTMEIVFNDGTVRSLLGNINPVLDSEGQPNGAVAAFSDITDWKRMTEELRRSRDELEIRVQERTAELMSVVEALQYEMAERKRDEEALQKLNYDLNERIKELNCLYSVCYNVERQYPLLEDKLQNIVYQIPSGCQYPEIACARIVLESKEYRTDNFKETPWRLGSNIIVDGERMGTVELCYSEEKPIIDEGPFLKEERALINTIAIELGEMIGHMQADAALKEQSRILEAFFTSTVTPLVFLDRDFNFVRVNQAYAKACQRDISEFKGHNHFEFYPSDAKAIFERVVETRTPYQAVARPFTFPDHPEWGTTYWDWTLTPVLDDAGEVEYLVFSIQDVTERKRAEEALRAASLYARSLIEASLDPLVTISADGKIMDVNSATEKVTGLSRGQLIGSDFSDYFTEPEKAREGYRKVFVEGLVRDYPLAIQHVSGRITDVLYNATVYRNEAGEVQGVFAVARDITKRKRAEEALKAASLYARTLIEASLDPLVTISKDGRIMDVNRTTEQVTGLSRGQLIGSDFSDYFTEPEKARQGYRKVFVEGLVRDYPLAIQHVSGRITDVLYNATVYTNEVGEVQGVFAAARDITKRKQAEEALKESEKHLRYLSSHLMAAQESERKRISRELHDGLGQSLTAIKFKVEVHHLDRRGTHTRLFPLLAGR